MEIRSQPIAKSVCTLTTNVFYATVYPKKYAYGFVVLCFVVVMQSFTMNSHEVFIHIHQGCFAGTEAIVRLPQCQWSKPGGYGKISQCITTTKHSKAKTVCIFLGIYCMTVKIIKNTFINVRFRWWPFNTVTVMHNITTLIVSILVLCFFFPFLEFEKYAVFDDSRAANHRANRCGECFDVVTRPRWVKS